MFTRYKRDWEETEYSMRRMRRRHPHLFTPEGIPVVQSVTKRIKPSAAGDRKTADQGGCEDSGCGDRTLVQEVGGEGMEQTLGSEQIESAGVGPASVDETGSQRVDCSAEEQTHGEGVCDPAENKEYTNSPAEEEQPSEDINNPADEGQHTGDVNHPAEDEQPSEDANSPAEDEDDVNNPAEDEDDVNNPAEDEDDVNNPAEEDGDSPGESDSDYDDDDGLCEDTQDEMRELEQLIPGLSDQYRLLGKIGEGTFSTVYKALDLQHARFDNSGWTMIYDGGARRARVVAIKKIYVTSSPARIANEISILSDLSGSRFIAPLVTAMRREDQVVVVLPYFRNDDFRRFYTDMAVSEMRWYLASLLGALAHAHARGIMHRDIKPSNFLYDVRRRHGVLVDFGLAEREDAQDALRVQRTRQALQMDASTAKRLFTSFDARGRPGVPRKDTRFGLRANRAGTRGFRAPEVLVKVARQTVAIDMWSVGVILLCLLTRRFPFFQSTDDTEALLEIAVLFGRLEMERAVAGLGRTFLTNVPTVKDRGIRFESLAKAYNAEGYAQLPPEVFDLLRRLLTLCPSKRITAAEALEHPFVAARE